jgi:hypothetical protein
MLDLSSEVELYTVAIDLLAQLSIASIWAKFSVSLSPLS